ncbi:MAG: hypothetical protein KC983_11490, partial [Phycisphaerales bacterium]|nr:hypothetical protein [Phycisphaerales bacterium]
DRSSGEWKLLNADDADELAGDDDGSASIALWCLFAVLALLIIETVLARLFSHAGGHRRTRTGLRGSVRGAMESAA